jgi:hypothetical protein
MARSAPGERAGRLVDPASDAFERSFGVDHP